MYIAERSECEGKAVNELRYSFSSRLCHENLALLVMSSAFLSMDLYISLVVERLALLVIKSAL